MVLILRLEARNSRLGGKRVWELEGMSEEIWQILWRWELRM